MSNGRRPPLYPANQEAARRLWEKRGESSGGASPIWTFETAIDDTSAGISIQINSRTMPEAFPDLVPKKHYSYEIGSLYDSNGASKYSRWFRVTLFSEQGRAQIPSWIDADALIVLLYRAKEWCLKQEQDRQNEITKRRREGR